MNLQNNKQSGFTIVELLIVIVVIAILAAISVVTFTGIQNRARTSSGQQLASQVETKAQAFYTVAAGYPAAYDQFEKIKESKLEGIASANFKSSTLGNAADGDQGKSISYEKCGTDTSTTADGVSVNIVTGAKISYWDYAKNAVETKTIGDCS